MNQETVEITMAFEPLIQTIKEAILLCEKENAKRRSRSMSVTITNLETALLWAQKDQVEKEH